MLNVEMFGPNGSDNYLALIDSGSDTNVFSVSVAEALGFDGGQEITWEASGAKDLPGTIITVTYKLEFDGAVVSWEADTIFSDRVTQRNVLGRSGFFDHFMVAFRERNREFDLQLYDTSAPRK